MEPKDLKYFLDQMKLILSSLFARQMSYAIFGCPKLQDNELLFSNVEPDMIEIYESDPEFYFHKVTIHDGKFLELLYQQYPLLRSHVICLKVREFMSGVNKSSKTLTDSKLSLSGQELSFDCGPISIPCGQVISEFTANHYYDIFTAGLPDGENPYEMNMEVSEMDPTQITYMNIQNHDNGSCQSIFRSKCMLLQGKNIISTKEYLQKSKVKEFTLKLIAGGTKQALKVSIHFDCALLSVVSSQPGIRYYAR